MIPENFLTKYNKDATVPYSRIKDVMITIRQYASVDDSKENKASNDVKIESSMIDMGMRIQKDLATAKDDLVTELVTVFFKLSNEEKETLDYQVREEMFQKIATDRKELIDFLSLTSLVKASVSPTSSVEMPTQVSSLPTQIQNQE